VRAGGPQKRAQLARRRVIDAKNQTEGSRIPYFTGRRRLRPIVCVDAQPCPEQGESFACFTASRKKSLLKPRCEKLAGLALLSNIIYHNIMPQPLRAAADAARR